MTNIKKIGLSALAGALAMTSAHAGALSLTGSMEVTYTKGSGYQNDGSPFGQANDLTFAASTELENGVTVDYKRTTTDTAFFDDSELKFGNVLGGTVAMTSTGDPIGDIDDVTPTAFEEANAQLGSITSVGGSSGDFGLRYTLSDLAGTGLKLDMMYYPRFGTGGTTGDQATSGGGEGNEDAQSYTLTGTTEGLSYGVGYAQKSYNLKNTAGSPGQDRDEATVYLKYATGPLSVGAQFAHVTTQGLGNISYDNKILGISYQVSEDLALSYNRLESTKTGHQGSGAGEGNQQDFDSISVSYSVGGMTFGIADADCSNCSYTAARSMDETTVSLSIAF